MLLMVLNMILQLKTVTILMVFYAPSCFVEIKSICYGVTS